MFIPHTYPTALLLMLLSMVCWGSWANTQKADARWRFELFYLDYSLGLLACALIVGLTAGNLHAPASDSFFANLRTAGARSLVEALGGGVVFTVGALFLADNLGYLHFPIWQLWPVVLIGVGIMMLWNRAGFVGVPRAARKQYERWNLGYIHPDNLTSSGLVHEFTIFGGSKRVVTTQDFRGGKIATIFGGCSLDLTGAAIAGDTAVLYVSALYGGSTIKIPPTWNVEVHGAGIFGGVAIKN